MELSKTLGLLTKATGVLVAVSLVLSVVYDWGFLWALDIGFIDVPTSISDHIRSGLLWLPNVLLGAFFGIAIEFATQRIEGGRTEEEIIRSSKNPEVLRKLRRSPLIFFRIFVPTVAVGFFLAGRSFGQLLPLASIIAWLVFSEWAENTPRIQLGRSRAARQLFRWLPTVLLFVFFLGYKDASSLAAADKPDFKIFLNRVESPIHAKILRHMEKGTLVIQAENKKISFFTWPEVSRIEALEPYTPYYGLLGRRDKEANSKPPD